MSTQKYHIRALGRTEPIPFELLLLADETKEAIEKYAYDSDIYLVQAYENADPIGVFALYRISDNQVEIKNIGVLESFRNQGIGSFLIERIKQIASERNYREIIVGTPATGIREIRFYERNGFSKYAVKKDFFIENYAVPIVENGILLRDMVMLRAKSI
jgi:ribosomal protein S18 acetylase RimI-like enzyme